MSAGLQDILASSPWLTLASGAAYISNGQTTAKGHPRFSKRFLSREVKAGRLRAARVGGRGQILIKREWLDQFLEDLATPVSVPVRRRA